MNGTQLVGGLAGYNAGTITGSFAEVAVTASSTVAGGLAGYNSGIITNSYAVGKVSSTNQYVGGLVGLNGGTIGKSYAAGEFGQFMPNVSVQVQNRDGALLQDHEPVSSGARVYLTLEDKHQYIDTIRLSDHVREKLGLAESAQITLKSIAQYVIREAEDVTGDEQFDQQDVRLLLCEME